MVKKGKNSLIRCLGTRKLAVLLFQAFFCSICSEAKEDSFAWTWPIPSEVSGTWYEVTVPDTLDLAERAQISLNVLTGALDPEYNYEIYFVTEFQAQPPFMAHERTGLPTNNPKFAESMPMMRVMCGSNLNHDIEIHNMERMVSILEKHGLYYALKENRPWHGAEEDFANVYGNTRLLLAMKAWYHFTGDPVWKKRIQTITHSLAEIAINKDDYAYFPLSNIGEWFSYGGKTGWLSTDTPDTEAPGEHPTVLYIGPVLRGLAQWLDLTDDPKAQELADKLVTFLRRPDFWVSKSDSPYIRDADRAHWNYHVHGWVAALRGLLNYAMVKNDPELMEFVRDGYEYARNYGIARIGWFHEVTQTGTPCESCCIADMVALAIKLNDAGVGDYWDDVDRYVRNQLVEQQFTDAALLRKISEAGEPHKAEAPRETADRVIERNLGGFAGKSMVDHVPNAWIMHCCTANGTQALYYAWESIIRFDEKTHVAEINLLLNRASPWMDINSYLPYEGKVTLKNKKARIASIRIPRWVDKSKIKIQREVGTANPLRSGSNLLCLDLKPKEVITITFPMQQRIEKVALYNTEYTFTFRGNTVMDISPRSNPPGSYPLYLREHMKYERAPLKTIKRFVCDVLIPW